MHLAGQGEIVSRRRDSGYAMVALIMAITVMAIVMTAAMPVWKHAAQREKEEELVFRGEQYVHAIGLFQRRYANAFPPNIDILVQQKFLRKKYKDPITNDDFVPLTQAAMQGGVQPGAQPGGPQPSGAQRGAQTMPQGGPASSPQTAGRGGPQTGAPGPLGGTTAGGAPAGGIIGVTSKSKEESIRLYKGRSHYNEWAFIYTAPVQGPGAATPGGRGQPGQPGQPPIPGAGRGPFPGGPGRGTPPPMPGTQGQPPIFGGPGRGR